MKNGELKIEKNIPLPDWRRGTERGPLAEALSAMKPGDSVLADVSIANANQSARRYIGPRQFAVRTEANGVRIWRLK